MEQIILKCQAGEKEAQAILYDKYVNKVFRTAYLLSKNKELAEDITQETFIRVFSKISLYTSGFTFDAWLYSVTTNVAKNVFRKQRWANFFTTIDDYGQLGDLGMIERGYNRKENEVILRQTLVKLPYNLREVIVLKYYNNFSQKEIANILKIPIGTVKSRINSALKKVRKALSEDNLLEGVLINE